MNLSHFPAVVPGNGANDDDEDDNGDGVGGWVMSAPIPPLPQKKHGGTLYISINNINYVRVLRLSERDRV